MTNWLGGGVLSYLSMIGLGHDSLFTDFLRIG